MTIVAHNKAITSLRASADGMQLATCSHDRTIKLWSIGAIGLSNSGTLVGHRRSVADAIFH